MGFQSGLMTRVQAFRALWGTYLPLLAVMALLCAMTSLAQSEQATSPGKALKGVALVIGNGDYEHIARLANPASDARAIEAMLDGLGFETDIVADRDARRLRRALEGFVEDAEGADVAAIYYSGHGIEAGGENYLVPVDADISALGDADEKLVPLSAIVEDLKRTVPVTILMLDACRSNPFPKDAVIKTTPEAAAAAIGSGGLGEARGAVSLSTKPARGETFGTVIGFAAEPGKVALDGKPGGNSPYAAAILRHLAAMEGAEFGTVMRMVAEEVYLKTDGRQRPWVNESLGRLLYFGTPAPKLEGGDGAILAERRQLLLTIAALPEPGRRRIETLARSGEVPMDALYGMLKALGAEAPQDPAKLEQLMRGQTERLKAMFAERAALQNADPEIARLTSLSDRALREGALATAISALDAAKARISAVATTVDRAEADIAAKRREFAAVYARSGETRALAFDFAAAATDFGQAYDQIARWDDRLALTYRTNQSYVLEQQGTLRGDKAALEDAVVTARDALDLAERLDDRAAWATTQNALGSALFTLGDRDSESDHLAQAATAFRAALAEATKLDPRSVADIRNNLANVLTVLGTRAGNDATLVEAGELYNQAIDQFIAQGDLARSSTAFVNFGKTMLEVGMLRNSLETIEMAAEAFEATLTATSREQAPMVWGAAQNNLGNVQQALGYRTPDSKASADRHLAALVAYRNALLELTRERYPLQWASVHLNIAGSLRALSFAQPTPEAANDYLRQAAEAGEAALLEASRERAPAIWASVKRDMAQTSIAMANRARTPAEAMASLKAASAQQQEALQVMSAQNNTVSWIETQTAYADTFAMMSTIELDKAARREHLIAAEAAYRSALGGLRKGLDQRREVTLMHAIGVALVELGAVEGGTARYEAAEAFFRDEESRLSRIDDPVQWAKSQAGLGNALKGIGTARRDRAMLEDARRRTRDARAAIQPFDTSYNAILDQRLAEIEAALTTAR